MADATVAPVETLRVRTVQDPHSLRQVRLWRSDRDMEMVSEHAVALADPVVSRNGLADLRDEPDEIPIVQAHSLLRVAPRRNVVERTGELDPRVSAHRSSVGLADVKPRFPRRLRRNSPVRSTTLRRGATRRRECAWTIGIS